MDDRLPEDVTKLENALREADFIAHPFHAGMNSLGEVRPTKVTARPAQVRRVDNNEELPLEEAKRREAEAQGKKFRVPEWWLGEEKAYKMGKSQQAGLSGLGNFG